MLGFQTQQSSGVSGALTTVRTFNVEQVKFCSMHSLNLGFVLWSAGSSIESLINWGAWGDNYTPYNVKLQRAFGEFKAWSKRMRVPYPACKK